MEEAPSSTGPGFVEQVSTRVVFFIIGFGMASWAPLVPYAKARLGLDEGMLGLLLLCLGVGSIVAMPFSGVLVARFGCRRVIVVASLLMCAMLPLLGTAANIPVLAFALLVFGAGVGTTDVAVNIQAVIVEKASGRAMMSGFHGLYSAGGIAGAGVVSALLTRGVAPLAATLGVAVALAGMLALFERYLLSYGTEEKTPLLVVPRGVVLVIGVLCLIVFLSEGTMLDWSAVYLTNIRNGVSARSGMGYVVFAAAMTVGRLTGDAIVHRLGGKAVLLYGALCAAAGFALAVIVPSWTTALVGFGMIGAGCSNIVPVLFTQLGQQKDMPPNLAVSSATTLGYTGILAGPALIGFVAHATSLSAAFVGVALLLLGVAIIGPRIVGANAR